jgi:putative DNA primase/helicase
MTTPGETPPPAPAVDAVKKGPRVIRPGQPQEPGAAWESRLMRSPKGKLLPCITNAQLLLDNHPAWAGRLRYNDFTNEIAAVRDLPDPVCLKAGGVWRDHHDSLVQTWFETETGLNTWSIDVVRRAVDCISKAHSFNPVTDYLNALPAWDGVCRLDTWLVNYCSAWPEKGEDEAAYARTLDFTGAIGRRWWISLVARAFEPGCMAHHVLVLEGEKGIGKSSLADAVFGEYYAVILGDVNSKDNQALMSAGVWGVLLDELDVLSKSERRAVKSWVTRRFEKFRPAYGVRHEKRPRGCVFLGGVNSREWASEEDRRWWPVACNGPIDIEGLKRDRDLLMAEAVYRYRARERWYFHAELDADLISTAKEQQAARVPENVLAVTWLVKAREVAEQQRSSRLRGTASIGEILEKALVPLDRRQFHQQDIGRTLKAAGWKQAHLRLDEGMRERRWISPEFAPESFLTEGEKQ